MPQKIKLEDLLKLKRAERPSNSDWERFDAELKRRLVREIVGEPYSKRFFDGVFSRTFAVYSSALGILGAVLAIAVAPTFIASFSSETDLSRQDAEFAPSHLPNIEKSFAINELPVSEFDEQTLVSANINSSDSNPVRYVSSSIGGGFGGNVF